MSSHYQTASQYTHPVNMGPNQNQSEARQLFASSPRNQGPPVHLLDDDLRRDVEEQEQAEAASLRQQEQHQQQGYRMQVEQHQRQQQQQGQGEGADIQIVGVVEVRNWKMFAGNVRW